MITIIRSGVKKFIASLALLSLELVAAILIFLVALIAFIQVAKMVFLDRKDEIDNQAFAFMAQHVSPFNTEVMQFFTFLGTHSFLIPANIVLVSYFLVIRKHRWYSIKIPVVAISSVLLMYLLKFIFNRPRPLIPLLEPAHGLSFPSGHALNSVAFYGLLIYLVWRNVTNVTFRVLLMTALGFIILMIGLSRIYLHVHYATDVMAGFCVGLMWLLISLWLLKKMETFSKKKITPAIDTDTTKASAK